MKSETVSGFVNRHMDFEPRNILVIDFGQVGDVVLSLPALEAIKRRFGDSKLTVIAGQTARGVVEMSGLADEIICVDRYALRDSAKLWSAREVIKIVRKLRGHKFDFVIDLHSMPETNLLGYSTGAKFRLFANRGNRSLDFLSNFRPKPPLQDRTIHKSDDYLRNLIPLGINDAPRIPKISPLPSDLEFVRERFREEGIAGQTLAGISPGAGNPLRKWNLGAFAELSAKLSADENVRVLVFLGPEELQLKQDIARRFSPEVKVFDGFSLRQAAAAFSLLDVFIGNDSGPIHLAAALRIPTILIVRGGGPTRHRPLGDKSHEIENEELNNIKPDEVYALARKILAENNVGPV